MFSGRASLFHAQLVNCQMGFKATPAGFVHTSIFCPQNILLLLAKDHMYMPKADT